MGTTRLIDCIDVVGRSCKPFVGEKKYISTGAVGIDTIDKDQIEIVTFSSKPSRANVVVEIGDILFAKMQSTNKVLRINDELDRNIYSTGFYAIRPKTQLITYLCLFYLLTSKGFNVRKDKECHGATQKALNNEGLTKIIINLPSIEEQNKLEKELSNVNLLIDSNKRKLKLYEELIKSRFVEMFGELEKTVRLGDCCEIHARIGWQALTKDEHRKTGDYMLITGTDLKMAALTIHPVCM